jgi:hypothetical protein
MYLAGRTSCKQGRSSECMHVQNLLPQIEPIHVSGSYQWNAAVGTPQMEPIAREILG